MLTAKVISSIGIVALSSLRLATTLSAQEVPKDQVEAQCWGDYAQYCGALKRGGSRIYDCLEKNKATLTNHCRNALPALKVVSDKELAKRIAQAKTSGRSNGLAKPFGKTASSEVGARPRLVLQITVDQLRGDLVDRELDLHG